MTGPFAEVCLSVLLGSVTLLFTTLMVAGSFVVLRWVYREWYFWRLGSRLK